MRERAHRGGQLHGTTNGNSRLTEAAVIDIRGRYKPRCPVNGARALARAHGVHRETIQKAISGARWSHVDAD